MPLKEDSEKLQVIAWLQLLFAKKNKGKIERGYICFGELAGKNKILKKQEKSGIIIIDLLICVNLKKQQNFE